MNKSIECQLWRVDLIHRDMYQAPSLFIEVDVNRDENEYKNAHKLVMKMNLRLLDFPEKWSFRLIKLDRVRRNGKWYS